MLRKVKLLRMMVRQFETEPPNSKRSMHTGRPDRGCFFQRGPVYRGDTVRPDISYATYWRFLSGSIPHIQLRE
jgi:hypothetical protein